LSPLQTESQTDRPDRDGKEHAERETCHPLARMATAPTSLVKSTSAVVAHAILIPEWLAEPRKLLAVPVRADIRNKN
jgi:hypothetical protein